jgi:tetratricopeptide (TPR) repeat protein
VMGLALMARSAAALWCYRMLESIECADRALKLLQAPSMRFDLMEALGNRHACLGFTGRFEEADEERPRLLEMARETGHRGLELFCDLGRAFSQLLPAGDLDAVASWAEGTLTAWAAAGPWAEINRGRHALVQLCRGDAAGAIRNTEIGRLALPPCQWTGILEGVQLYAAAHLDDAAWHDVAPNWRRLLPASGVPELAGQRVLASFLARARVLRGELAEAAGMHDTATALVQDGCAMLEIYLASTVAGMTAAAGGQWAESERHFQEALELGSRLRHRPGLADARHWYGWMLIRRDAAGDRERAHGLLDEAMAEYAAMGMTRPLADARALRGEGDMRAQQRIEVAARR